MKQFILFILLFLPASVKLSASTHFDAALLRPHAVVMMHGSYGNGADKASILGAILESMVKQYFNDTPYIFVQFGDDLLYKDYKGDLFPMQYALGYDTLAADQRYWISDSRNKKSNPKVLSLYCSDVQFDIPACLKLIWFGLRYKNLVSAQQQTVTSLRYSSTIHMPAITPDHIYDIIHYHFPETDALIKRKWFRYLSARQPARPIEYYYQNNCYYFYYIDSPFDHRPYNDNDIQKWQKDTAGRSILAVNDLYAITDGGTQFLILNTDSTAYYICPSRGIVKGPASIPYSGWAHVYNNRTFDELMMYGDINFYNRYDTNLHLFVPDFTITDSAGLRIFARDTLLRWRARKDAPLNKTIRRNGYILWFGIICTVIIVGCKNGRRVRSQ